MLRKARLALFVAAAGMTMAHSGVALGLTNSDESSAILVWPRVVYDSEGRLFDSPTDTLINLSSNADVQKQAHCFLVNATSHCEGGSGDGEACLTSSTCGGGVCKQSWSEIDFNVFITADQPLAWYAGDGLSREDLPIVGPGRCAKNPARICLSNAQCSAGDVCQIGPGGQNNLGTAVPPVPEDPFIGSLTCIQYATDPATNQPAPDQSGTTNALIGEATVFSLESGGIIDGAKYNAVGFAATANAGADTDNKLEIGTPADASGAATADYAGCAGTLIFNHYFDGATDPVSVGNNTNSDNDEVSTNLTLVPCGNNLLRQIPGNVVAQFLVFNEFEQRFSASKRVDCVYDSPISNIDTPNSERSIWSTGVSGTLTGQTRIQGVGNAPTGNGLTGIATVSIDTDPGTTSAAYSLDQMGSTVAGDILTIP
jgi:hypothetical protein